jgi:hypothetical protein
MRYLIITEMKKMMELRMGMTAKTRTRTRAAMKMGRTVVIAKTKTTTLPSKSKTIAMSMLRLKTMTEQMLNLKTSGHPTLTTIGAPSTHPIRELAIFPPASISTVPIIPSGTDPQLHTGVSFSMAEADIKNEDTDGNDSGPYECAVAKEVQQRCIASHIAMADEEVNEGNDCRVKREASPWKRKRSSSPDSGLPVRSL